MNKYLKEFLLRGMKFGGFGPIVLAIIYLCLEYTVEGFSPDGLEIFVAIISTYILAFIHAGASVFNQIEAWPIGKSIFFHFLCLYLAYTGCYLINTWIPFDPSVILIFTAIFLAIYFVIWITVFISVKLTSKKFNQKIK